MLGHLYYRTGASHLDAIYVTLMGEIVVCFDSYRSLAGKHMTFVVRNARKLNCTSQSHAVHLWRIFADIYVEFCCLLILSCFLVGPHSHTGLSADENILSEQRINCRTNECDESVTKLTFTVT